MGVWFYCSIVLVFLWFCAPVVSANWIWKMYIPYIWEYFGKWYNYFEMVICSTVFLPSLWIFRCIWFEQFSQSLFSILSDLCFQCYVVWSLFSVLCCPIFVFYVNIFQSLFSVFPGWVFFQYISFFIYSQFFRVFFTPGAISVHFRSSFSSTQYTDLGAL